ncbi:uncharacterized protein [Asterias amurensis]|uniref:uncharacterized protein n=1 Tax=Asterias amurensis TaxID=7602 RepID=UPI003AB357C0
MHFDLDAMAMTPPFVMEAYTPPEALWRLVEENVAPGEQQEIRDILGNSMVEQSLELRNEVEALLDIWSEYRQETESLAPSVPVLPEPPLLRKSLKGQIRILVESLKERAKESGRDSGLSLSRQSSNDILEYALDDSPRDCSSAGSLRRPSTAMSSRDGRDTPMRMTPSSDGDELSATSTMSDRVDSVKDQLNVLKIDEVVQELRSALEDEVSQLLRDISFLQTCLEDESDYRGQSRMAIHPQEPSLQELRAEKQALEKQLEEVSSFGTINLINAIKPKSSVLSSPTKKLPSPLVPSGRSPTNIRPSPPPSASSKVRQGPFKVPHPGGRVRPSEGSTAMKNGKRPSSGGDDKSTQRTSTIKTGASNKSVAKSRISTSSVNHQSSTITLPQSSKASASPPPQQLIPSPPSSARPPLGRPSSAQRFRTRVLDSRQGGS